MEEMIVEEIEAILTAENDEQLKVYLDDLNISDVEHLIDELPQHAVKFIDTLSVKRAVNVFRILDFPTQEKIIKKLPGNKLAELINLLPPDDRTSLFSELKGDAVKKLIILLPAQDRVEALSLLGYKEDSVGRLMTPDYVAVKKDWTVTRVLSHIRRYGKNSETIDVIYVIDKDGVLLDDMRIREILLADPEAKIGELTDHRLIALKVTDPQEEAINVFRMNNRVALPVVDDNNVLLGIVTVDDILWIANEEYTEDIHKIGGTQALNEPYLDVPVFQLYKKRVVWLIVLFFGELLTIFAMSSFESQIEKVVILATFIPLIISSGGNSGSQAATLIIQAMALGEITIKDWWRVMRREIVSGIFLGSTLCLLSFSVIICWQLIGGSLDQPVLIGLVVGCSLVGVVLWGTLMGSMLPLLLKKLGADPAVSSTPFVATLVDVTGLLIYFSMALLFLKGVLL
ncbi:magnesium transporter [Pedobacter metabolipauper]|uniref:Magnesium transporter MgtE n=1 Tax=Pedobacter metabolipauper TaxID=425513 RepID=A0A4R6SRA8_9SPHI|nr:magnesium transporter [Pedobacter metabolipauper]TDQ06962.1 magnesium transporter [Pedobacter metabolipauper]